MYLMTKLPKSGWRRSVLTLIDCRVSTKITFGKWVILVRAGRHQKFSSTTVQRFQADRPGRQTMIWIVISRFGTSYSCSTTAIARVSCIRFLHPRSIRGWGLSASRRCCRAFTTTTISIFSRHWLPLPLRSWEWRITAIPRFAWWPITCARVHF